MGSTSDKITGIKCGARRLLDKILAKFYLRAPGKSDFILQIILLHSRFYRYDVHDTILLKHIHFGSIFLMRWRF